LSTHRHVIAAAALLAVAPFAIAAPAQAGFLDSLFGIAPRPVLAPVPDSVPLHMTVRPRHKKSGQPVAAPGKDEPPMPRVMPMEYASDPFWYLKDATLKKGDIIVLKDRVVVFDGGARAYASFGPFQSSRLLSDRAKKQLKYLVSNPKDTHTVWEPLEVIKTRNATTAAELSERVR